MFVTCYIIWSDWDWIICEIRFTEWNGHDLPKNLILKDLNLIKKIQWKLKKYREI